MAKNRILKKLMAFAFLPAAIMALAFPTVTAYPPISFYTIHQFVMHAGIVAYIVAKYVAGEIRPRYTDLWISVLLISVIALQIYLIDLKFEANFMFLTNHSGNPVLKLMWDISGGDGGLVYVAALVAFITLVLHIVFVIYVLIGRATGKAK